MYILFVQPVSTKSTMKQKKVKRLLIAVNTILLVDTRIPTSIYQYSSTCEYAVFSYHGLYIQFQLFLFLFCFIPLPIPCTSKAVLVKPFTFVIIYFLTCSFYVILRGSASVYIDPKMTGEGSINDDALSSRTSENKRRNKNHPRPLETEESVLSGMEKPSEVATTIEDSEGSLVHTIDELDEEDDEHSGVLKTVKALAPLDRNKFGKFILNYGKSPLFVFYIMVNNNTSSYNENYSAPI